MRGPVPAAVALALQLSCLWLLLRTISLGVGVEASSNLVSKSAWNNLKPRGAWHEVVRRQSSSGNRTLDLYDFFSADLPPDQCRLDCEIIWGAVGACDRRSCLCTEPNGQLFVQCCDCLMMPTPTEAKADYYQGILTEFQLNYCEGFRVPALSLNVGPGGTSGPTLSTPIATGANGPDGTPTPPSGVLSPPIATGVVPNGAFRSAPNMIATVVLLGIVLNSF